MDIGDVISDSLRYPTSNWSKVIILGILFLLSIFIIPLFFSIRIYIQSCKIILYLV
jgi:hypothetical protein